jgi:uncharacterized protein YjbI with pentapeptide repeats
MAIDPKDLGALEKALNDAAGKASVLWTTFVTFELYLAIAFGSVKHRDLFLETPVKLPILNVDLPLVGFFVLAPIILVIFHFYVFLQLYGLATKAGEYNGLLKEHAQAESDRQRIRQRLDTFFVLQFLAGPKEQRSHFQGFSLRLIAWITLVGAPIVILLQGQVTFLAYHHEVITWVQRLLLFVDLVVIWGFWNRIRSEDNPILGPILSKIWPAIGLALSIGAFILSAFLATFPGERVEILTDSPYWTSLHELLFLGAADEVTGQPRSLFSNRLVLTDQTFVDSEKLEKVGVSHSFRGRDLTGAVLNRADLRQADFTGAILDDAQLNSAKLEKARFCATREMDPEGRKTGCASLRRTSLDEAQLQGASLVNANLQEAWLHNASLQGASLVRAHLQGASLDYAQLQGASLFGAGLDGASLEEAQLQGALLDGAQLRGASLRRAHLQGASLNSAQLQGVLLDEAWLQWVSLRFAGLQGASLDEAQLQGASLERASVWRVKAAASALNCTSLEKLDSTTRPWEERKEPKQTYQGWRDGILSNIPERAKHKADERLSSLDPDKTPRFGPGQKFWTQTQCPRQQGPDAKHLAEYLATLACSAEAAPDVARGLITYGRIERIGAEIATIADRLRKGKADPQNCPGVDGFTKEDWAQLDELVARVQERGAKTSAPSGTPPDKP